MSMELFMQYVTYALIAIGALAFVVSMITQIVKETSPVKNIPTNLVALAISVVLTVLAVVIACQMFKIAILWYYIVGAVIAAFIVYLVATGGWERVKEMWERTKYKNK